MGKEGKEGKKKSKGSSKTRDDEEEQSAAATRSVSIKILKEDPDTSGSLLACFADAPVPGDLLDAGSEPYEFQCQTSKNGGRTLAGQKVRGLTMICPNCSLVF